jgi:cellulose biosynthesis protein BcsQ
MSTFPTYFPVIKCVQQLKEKPIKFILREKYLNNIKDLFETNQILIIHGFGGVGKTTLALEYCNLLATSNDPDPNIRWFNSSSGEILEIEYKKLSRLLDINVIGEDLDFVIERTNMKLKQISKEILFVFDNVESYDDIERYINKKLPKNIKILITTRNQLKNVDFPKIELEPFGIEEAKEYLNKNLSKKDKTEDKIDRIVELAKSTNEYILPIKLEIIISYMNCYYIQDIEKSISETE